MNSKHEGPRSVTRQRKTFALAASPLNDVKLALGVIILVGVLLILVTGRLTISPAAQVLLLSCYGVVAALWLVVKTRRVAQMHQRAMGVSDAKPAPPNRDIEK